MKKPSTATVPVIIPTIVLTVHLNGTITATLDGNPLPPPANAPWRRSSLPQIIDQASQQRSIPVWVEVQETDGTTFTDLFPALPQAATSSKPPAPKRTANNANSVEVHAEGFLPGEDVAIAPIIGHTNATADGQARALIDTAVLPKVSEVVLLGRVSGTMTVSSLI
ncbi:hypothetical protein U6G28_06450 [Actinomycetaceae bacterium MB13-C1-2]|nr:hypothetical protein U6G28_06450 [Actinomycetaceae bacterium MB13-C1-2]